MEKERVKTRPINAASESWRARLVLFTMHWHCGNRQPSKSEEKKEQGPRSSFSGFSAQLCRVPLLAAHKPGCTGRIVLEFCLLVGNHDLDCGLRDGTARFENM